MKLTIILRIAAVLALVQGLAHGSIILFGGANRGADEVGVITVMKSHLFGQGTGRSYWDYYVGYALFAALTCVLEGVLFWQYPAPRDRCGLLHWYFLRAI